MYDIGKSSDGKYLYIYAIKLSLLNALYVKNIEKEDSQFEKIVDNFDNLYRIIDIIDDRMYVYTNHNAPNYKVIEIDINKPDISNWKDFIKEENEALQKVTYVGKKFITNYLHNAHSFIKIFDNKGRFLNDLDISPIGTINGFLGCPEDSITFYTVASFTDPSTIYRYDIKNNISTLCYTQKTAIDPDDYITKQVFFESKDGATVPMFIIHKKDIEMDGNNPTILYGFGGFGVTYTPHFDISRFILLEQGGIFALANIRGGGAYGEEWHIAGTKMNKQKGFDDFIAAAEYLINEKYTSPSKLALQGYSNGGLLVAAVTNQRPDLCAVSLTSMGIMDMLKYHLFTVGRYWANDYGTSNESEEMFKYLYSYSPIHNISPDIEYPAIMATVSIHDDRVVPAHSYKYIATLQDTYKGKNPVLIRIDTKSGQRIGKITSQIIKEISDIYTFTFYNLKFNPKY